MSEICHRDRSRFRFATIDRDSKVSEADKWITDSRHASKFVVRVSFVSQNSPIRSRNRVAAQRESRLYTTPCAAQRDAGNNGVK